ncbi:MAG: hypothetical protein Q8P20_03080 [bacterium]|nr:hypothetical protein [bacterium]
MFYKTNRYFFVILLTISFTQNGCESEEIASIYKATPVDHHNKVIDEIPILSEIYFNTKITGIDMDNILCTFNGDHFAHTEIYDLNSEQPFFPQETYNDIVCDSVINHNDSYELNCSWFAYLSGNPPWMFWNYLHFVFNKDESIEPDRAGELTWFVDGENYWWCQLNFDITTAEFSFVLE